MRAWVILQVILLGMCVALLLRRLAAKGTPWHVYVSVWVSWSCALWLVALVPLDLHIVTLKRCIDHYSDGGVVKWWQHNETACPVDSWRDIGVGETATAQEVLEKWLEFLKQAWIFVWTVCQVNGWILLTFQSSYIESRRFSSLGKIATAIYENFGFYLALGIINTIGIGFIYLAGLDVMYVVLGCLALFNGFMLTLFVMFLGYGLAEAPRALWQGSWSGVAIKTALYQVWENNHKAIAEAEDLASKMLLVHVLDRSAESTNKKWAREIEQIMSELPFELASVFLMDPLRGPYLPRSEEGLKKAYIAQLTMQHLESSHKQKTTQVDHWLAALEREGLLPEFAPLFEIQEKIFAGGYKDLDEIDLLDPALALGLGTYRQQDGSTRIHALIKKLVALDVPCTGVREGETFDACHQSLALAIMKRNDARFNMSTSARGPAAGKEEEAEAWLTTAEWGVSKLVKLRTDIYRHTRKYRKSKAKFDRSVKQCILLQDLEKAHTDLVCPTFHHALQRLYRACVHKDRSESGWGGLRSPVRAQYEGPNGIRYEVAWFVTKTWLTPLVKLAAALLCCLGSLAILQSQVAILPGVPQGNGLLPLHFCSHAAFEPHCVEPGEDVSKWKEWTPFVVGKNLQVTIGVHLFFICCVVTFVLVKLKIGALYEVVPGQTDSASLLLNAYIVCRLVPSLAHNYMAMIQEAGVKKLEVDKTAFESVFGALGNIPFVNVDFNSVIPIITVSVWGLTLANALLKDSVKMPHFDGLRVTLRASAKTLDTLDEAVFTVEMERRRYEVSRKQSKSLRQRAGDDGLNEELNPLHEILGINAIKSDLETGVENIQYAMSSTNNTIKDLTGIEMGPVTSILQDSLTIIVGSSARGKQGKLVSSSDLSSTEEDAEKGAISRTSNLKVSAQHLAAPTGCAGCVVTATHVGGAPQLSRWVLTKEESMEEKLVFVGGRGSGSRAGKFTVTGGDVAEPQIRS